MASRPSSPLRSVVCPRCSEQLAVRAGDLGKLARCRRCGAVFRLAPPGNPPAGASALAEPPPPTAPEAPAARAARPAPAPATVSFACELCQTRLTAARANVGHRLKCPDCGRENVVPPPEAVRPAAPPAALSGPQYAVWDADQLPDALQLEELNQHLHPVVCEVCQTLVYATDAQVGSQIRCPDCRHMNRVHARQPQRPQGPTMVPAGEEYELDEASPPPPRAAVVPITVRVADLRDQQRRALDEANRPHRGTAGPTREAPASEPAKATGDAVDRAPRLGLEPPPLRPERPAMPLVQGVLRMLLTQEVLTRWFALSITLAGVGLLLGSVFLGDLGGYGAVYLVLVFAAGSIVGGLWLLATLPLLVAIVVESSEGNDRLQDPPQWTTLDGFGELLFFAVSAALAALPAALAPRAAAMLAGELQGTAGALPVHLQGAIAAGVWLAGFPIALLSALEQGSPLAVLSTRIAASLVRCAGPWLLFYLLSGLLGAGVGAAAWFAVGFGGAGAASRLVALAMPWIFVGALLVYMRLLGRLAWWLAETMPPQEDADV